MTAGPMPNHNVAATATQSATAPNDASSIEKILQSTVTQVAQNGYEGATTKAIADMAGVSKSLLHYHFSTKEDLLIAALNYFADMIQKDVRTSVDLTDPRPELVLPALDALYELVFDNSERVQFLLQIYATAMYNERIRERLIAYREHERALVEAIALPLLEPLRGNLPLPPERLVSLFQTILIGISGVSTVSSDHRAIRMVYEDFRQMVVFALMATMMPAARGADRDNAI